MKVECLLKEILIMWPFVILTQSITLKLKKKDKYIEKWEGNILGVNTTLFESTKKNMIVE